MAREKQTRYRRKGRRKGAQPTFGERSMGALEAFGDKVSQYGGQYALTAGIRAAQEGRPVGPSLKAGMKGEDKGLWGPVLKNAGVENKAVELGLNVLGAPDILVNPLGKTAKGVQLAKAMKMSKGLGAQAKAGERALLTLTTPAGPVRLTPQIVDEKVMGALGKVGGAVKGSKIGKEFRKAFSDSTGDVRLDEFKGTMEAIIREGITNETNARIKMDKLVDEVGKKKGWTPEQAKGQIRKMLDYVEAEQSSKASGWKTGREARALAKLKDRMPKYEEAAKKSFEYGQKSGLPETVIKKRIEAKAARQNLTQAEYKLHRSKLKFPSLATKGNQSLSRSLRDSRKAIQTARKDAWGATFHGILSGKKLYIPVDEPAKMQWRNRKQSVKLMKLLKELGVRTTTKANEGVLKHDLFSGVDLDYVRAHPELPYPSILQQAANRGEELDDIEWDELVEAARENPHGKKGDFIARADVPVAREHEKLLEFMEGGDQGWMKYGFKKELDVTETARIGSLTKREDELKVALSKEADPEKAKALSAEYKNIQSEKRAVSEGATVRASDTTRKQIMDQYKAVKGEYDALKAKLDQMYKAGVNQDEIHALQHQYADLRIKLEDIDTKSDVFRAARYIDDAEKNLENLRYEASKAEKGFREAADIASEESKRATFGSEMAETTKRYSLLKKELEKARGIVTREKAKLKKGVYVDANYLKAMQGHVEHLENEISKIAGGSIGRYIKESERMQNLVGRIESNSKKFDEAVNAFRGEAAQGMDDEIMKLAKEAQVDMARIAKEGTDRDWFDAIAGYMTHYKAPELTEWLQSVPKERSQRALAVWDKTMMHRGFQGKTINEWNNIALSGGIGKHIPELDGFTGRLFDDDAAVVLALRRQAHTRLKAVDDFWKSTRDNLGMNKADFEAAKKAGTIDHALYEGINDKAFKDAKNPSGVVYFDKETATIIKDFMTVLRKPENVSQFETLLQRVNSVYKSYTLPIYPAYHIRNIVGNVLNNLLGGVWRVSAYAKAMAYQLGKDVVIRLKAPIEIDGKMVSELSRADLDKLIKVHGIADTGFYATEGIRRTTIEREKGGVLQALAGKSPIHKAGQKVGQALENNSKVTHFIHKLEDGFTPSAAAASVRKYTFDYSDVGWAGRKARLVMPFVSWTMKNVPLQMEALLTRPGLMAGYERARKTGLSDSKPDEAYMTQFMIENFPMYVGQNKDGNYMYFLGGSWIPAGDVGRVLGSGRNVAEIIRDTPAEMMKEIFMLINPLYTAPARIAFNYDPYYEGKVQAFPGQQRRLNVGPGGAGIDMPAKLNYALRQARPISEMHNLFAPDKPAGLNALRLLTGLKTNVYDPKKGRVQKVIQARKDLAELKGWLKYYKKKGDTKNVEAIQAEIAELSGQKALKERR